VRVAGYPRGRKVGVCKCRDVRNCVVFTPHLGSYSYEDLRFTHPIRLALTL